MLLSSLGFTTPTLIRTKRKHTNTTNNHHDYRRYPNQVKEMDIRHSDQAWMADITYVQFIEEEVYLAIFMDVFT